MEPNAFECCDTNYLWNQMRYFLPNSFNILPLTPLKVRLGLINQNAKFLILNHLFLIYKFYTYNSILCE